MEYYVGVDLGATNLRAVVGHEGPALEASVVGEARVSTPKGPDGEMVSGAVVAVVEAACDDAGVAPEAIEAAAVGSIGPLDPEAGCVVDPVNLPDSVDRIELAEPLRRVLATDEVSVLNDTTAGVVGERAADPERPDDIVYLTISTGVGAGACVDGRVLSGANGNAGEVGHTTLHPAGRMTCHCGAVGHWEAYCSGTHLPDYARTLHAPGVATALPLDSPEFTAADVFAHAPEDEFAARVVDRVGEWNAIGVANIVHTYAPTRVVVGGAVAINNPEQILTPIREQLPERSCIPVPDIELTRLGDDAVLLGALRWAMGRE